MEARTFGINEPPKDSSLISSRLKDLIGKVDGIEYEVKDLVACRDLIDQLKPLLNKKQNQLNTIVTYANEIYLKKYINFISSYLYFNIVEF